VAERLKGFFNLTDSFPKTVIPEGTPREKTPLHLKVGKVFILSQQQFTILNFRQVSESLGIAEALSSLSMARLTLFSDLFDKFLLAVK
jgi:hypothetical protein